MYRALIVVQMLRSCFSVLCSDDSIFNGQTGFRRAELNPANNDGTDPATEGVKTVHFSLMKDDKRALNLSHEYQLFFLESKFVLPFDTFFARLFH